MLCVIVALLCAATIQACPDPQTMVHIQNYDGPIIVHSTTCDHPHCNTNNLNNQNKHNSHYETDCTCVTRQSYNPYGQSGYATNYGYSNQFCNADNVKVYPAVDNGYNYGANKYGNKNCQYQCSGYYAQ